MVQCEINEYFARHPEMMLGRMGMESGQYGMAPALIGNLEPGDLERAVSLLPAAVYKSRDSQVHVMRAQVLIKFLRSARSKKAGSPNATARSSFAAATRSSR